MGLDTYYHLRRILAEVGGLQDSRLTIDEKIFIFLYMVTKGSSYRDTTERFAQSLDTISRCFHEVLDSLILVYPAVVSLPEEDDSLWRHYQDNYRFWPQFKDCVGAIDRTHIDKIAGVKEQGRFRNRKDHISQNVIADCNFNMNFVYIYAGWEGSAQDGRVLKDAQLRHNLKLPEEKYWLGDTGYGNSKYVLAPYRGVRYHLREQRLAVKRPETPGENFNLRHASLRNIIERIFGVLKGKFWILLRLVQYSDESHTYLIIALAALHYNFRQRETIEVELDAIAEDGDEMVKSQGVNHGSKQIDSLREEITVAKWEQYTKYRNLS